MSDSAFKFEAEAFGLNKIVPLWALGEEEFFGLIVLMETGMSWMGQTAGTMCNHPTAEGLFVPLPLEWYKANPIENAYNFVTPLSVEENAKIVGKFLKENPEADLRFEVDLKTEVRAQEAWVPVRVKTIKRDPCDWDILAPFYGKSGILIYQNSD